MDLLESSLELFTTGTGIVSSRFVNYNGVDCH